MVPFSNVFEADSVVSSRRGGIPFPDAPELWTAHIPGGRDWAGRARAQGTAMSLS